MSYNILKIDISEYREQFIFSTLIYLMVCINPSESERDNKYFIYSFADDQKTIQSMIQDLKKRKSITTTNIFKVTDCQNRKIELKWNLEQIGKHLKLQNPSGLKIHIHLFQNYKNFEVSPQKQYEFFINLVPIKQNFYLNVKLTEEFTINHLKQAICEEILKIYEVEIRTQDINIKEMISHKQMQINLQEKDIVYLQLKNNDMINAYYNQSNYVLPSKQPNSGNLLKLHLYIDQGKPFLVFNYQQIKYLKVWTLFKTLGVQNYQGYGMLILDKIIYPGEKFQLFQELFSRINSTLKFIVVKALKEKYIFNQLILMEMKQPFNYFEQSKIALTEKGEQTLKELKQIAVKHLHSKNQQQNLNLENQLVLVWSFQSNIQMKQNQKIQYLGKSCNQYLRKKKYLIPGHKHIDKQQSHFCFNLIQSLKNGFPKFEGQSYRGVNYHFYPTLGSIIDFKQILVTYPKLEDVKKGSHRVIFKIKGKNGRLVAENLKLQSKTDEVIYPPYTQFKVTSITKKNTLSQVQLEQFQSGHPTSYTSIILWIDANKYEAVKAFDEVDHVQTTVFYQLGSNKQLTQWLQNHLKKLPSCVKVSLVTNMRRVEQGIQVTDAGVKSIMILRQFIPDAQILVYVGYIPGAIANLAKNHVIMDRIRIGDKRMDVLQFIIDMGRNFHSNLNKQKAEEKKISQEQQKTQEKKNDCIVM